jgi:septum formation inhibitor MinC
MTKKSDGTPDTSLVTKPSLSSIVKTDAVVDMNSIVAFFISKYENNLLDTKKQLSERITELNTFLNKDFLTLVKEEVKIDTYNVTVKALGLVTEAKIQVDVYGLTNKKVVQIHIGHSDKMKERNCHFQMIKEVVISDELHTKFTETHAEINKTRQALSETLDKLSSVSRKERELRGALAEKTLRDAGVGELFEDQALLDLVQVPQLAMKTVS